MSQSAVVQTIVNFGPVSRASVSKSTGLSKQTVSEIVAKLENEGWVRTVGLTKGHVGRRAVVYEILPTAATIASVDLGGTKVRVALCDLTGAILSERTEMTDTSGGKSVVTQIARLVHETASSHNSSLDDLHIAVVGVPGAPDPTSGAIRLAPNIRGLDSVDFVGNLRDLLDVEVFVENDVNLAALGEHWMGNWGGDDNLVYISIGTGIGAGIVLGGNLLRGRFGAAGEIGFLPFGADPFEAESLKVGALERVSATSAIVAHYQARTHQKKEVPEIFAAATQADEAALHTLDAIAREIARVVVAIVAVVDPSIIVIGGSIGSRDELFARVLEYASRCYPRKIDIKKTRLGDHAALAGGVAIALSHLHMSLFAEGQKGAEIAVPPPPIENFKVGAA